MVRKSQKKDQKTFRVCARKLFLTYSQLNNDLSAKGLLKLLRKNPLLWGSQYVIGKELHQEEGAHFHVILVSKTKLDIRNPEILDIDHEGKIFHGNYQPVKNLQQAVKYVCKDREYITDLPELIDGRLLSEKEFLASQVEKKGVATALLDYTKDHPEKAFSSRSVSALKKNFKDIQEMENSLRGNVLKSPFKLQNFDLKDELKEWVENPNQHKKKALILIGESGIGKTEFGKVFCIEKQLKTLVVNHKEDFQKIDLSHDAIIVDDANVGDFEKTQLLALLDNTTDRSVRVLYQTVTKKEGVVMIMLMNHAQLKDIYQTVKQKPFLRRALVYEPEQPFMINVNIQNNIQIHNVHNGDVINNNGQAFQQHQEREQEFIKANYARLSASYNKQGAGEVE